MAERLESITVVVTITTNKREYAQELKLGEFADNEPIKSFIERVKRTLDETVEALTP